jgi:hypothetical protein
MISPDNHERLMKESIQYVKSAARASIEHRDKMIKLLLIYIYGQNRQELQEQYHKIWNEISSRDGICGGTPRLNAEDFK